MPHGPGINPALGYVTANINIMVASERYYGGYPTVLTPYVKNNQLFWCPSDTNKPSTVATAPVSYYWRHCIDVYGLLVSGPCDSAFGSPAQQIILHDDYDWHGAKQGFGGNSVVNCAFVDGHAKVYNKFGSTHNGDPNWFDMVDGWNITIGYDS